MASTPRKQAEAETVTRTVARPAKGKSGSRARAQSSLRMVEGGRSAIVAGREAGGHRREILALVLFGLAVFLGFVLAAGTRGGAIGEVSREGLTLVAGRLAWLVPLGLCVWGVALVTGVRMRRPAALAGVISLLVGVLLLVAAGFPPAGGHAAETFVRAEYLLRAGWLGEVLYAGLHRLAGGVGVAVVAWVATLAGLSVVTGLTLRHVTHGTQKAAQVFRARADETERLMRASGVGPRVDDEADLQWELIGVRRPADSHGTEVQRPGATPTGVWDDLTAVSSSCASLRPPLVGATAPHDVNADRTFDDWGGFEAAVESPQQIVATTRGVVDGAEQYADLFARTIPLQPSDPRRGARSVMEEEPETVGREEAASALRGEVLSPGSTAGLGLEAGAGVGPAAVEGVASAAVPSGQRALPGLEHERAGGAVGGPSQVVASEPGWLMPEPELLRKSAPPSVRQGQTDRDVAGMLVETLSQFGVEARIVGMVVGPRVTRYELQLAPGTKVAKVSSLKDDLAYALATTEIRILTPIPGKSAVGVEVPNQHPDFVTLGDIFRDFPKTAGPLMVWLGKDISGKAVYTDLTRLPHLLIAGTTGSGKSGCINCIVSSVLLRATPDLVRMIMIDPKKVELSHYDRIPHLLVPVVTNMKDASGVLHNLTREMEDRYELMELEHARNLPELNKARARRGERPVPFILIVIDELADLMMVSPAEVEDYVIRIAQKARAVGIHLVVATQRPSADVITGMIKANIPSRIAFAVSSQTDSRVILDVNGAETLLGMGDMLFKPLGSSHMQRIQGAYVTEEEISHLVHHWRHQAEPEFREELLRRPAEEKPVDDLFDPDSDELLADAAQLVLETGSASVSMLQRRLRVGYTRAGRLIDMLERRGIVGPWEGSKPRQILASPDEYEHVLIVLRAEEARGSS